MTKYTCRIEGIIIVEASTKEEAEMKAAQIPETEWEWNQIEVDDD
jgi:hypothetical protein